MDVHSIHKGGNEVIPMNNGNRQDARGPLKKGLYEKRLKWPSLDEESKRDPYFRSDWILTQSLDLLASVRLII
jgi:hypothetical protein